MRFLSTQNTCLGFGVGFHATGEAVWLPCLLRDSLLSLSRAMGGAGARGPPAAVSSASPSCPVSCGERSKDWQSRFTEKGTAEITHKVFTSSEWKEMSREKHNVIFLLGPLLSKTLLTTQLCNQQFEERPSTIYSVLCRPFKHCKEKQSVSQYRGCWGGKEHSLISGCRESCCVLNPWHAE